MTYTFLSPSLHSTADKVKLFLTNMNGIRRVNIEIPVAEQITISPTLWGVSPRGFLICVEVSEGPYPLTMDTLILDCITSALPIKVYVAKPASKSAEKDEQLMRRLSEKGGGLIIVSDTDVQILLPAIELSLLIPEISFHTISKTLRPAVREAYNTYKNGDPVNGVKAICEEVEAYIRKIAKKFKRRGIIPPNCNLNFDRCPLANVIDQLNINNCIRNKALLGRCSAVTEVRNNSDHPPINLTRRKARHLKLKTNFNWALSLLMELHSVYSSR